MAKNLSSSVRFLVLLISIVCLMAVGDCIRHNCSNLLGKCDTIADCTKSCQSIHKDGLGMCHYNLCTCFYNGPPPPPAKKCLAGYLGLYDAKCNSWCSDYLINGKGFSKPWNGKELCICEYDG
uniref:Defensin-like protein n=1 Tax=Lotus japonicus TaxID=34305 RepID=I3SJZ1_LOTJA|nr:unknown [Lotus japonicus]